MSYPDWALVVPMANEENEFYPFIDAVKAILNKLNSGTVYFIVDNVSKDNTYKICKNLSEKDQRFKTIWAPENKNVVNAYMRGYLEAAGNGHKFIIEMDAGLSHAPAQIPLLLDALAEGYECAFGSRFLKNFSMMESSPERYFLSKAGTILSNILLGTRLKDMTSGFQGFRAEVVRDFLNYHLLSKAHFYQTELRFLLRKRKYIEVPISYKAPSPNVSFIAIRNSIYVLLYYFCRRLVFIKDKI